MPRALGYNVYGMATHKCMPCRIDRISMSLGLRVDVGAHINVVKIDKITSWLEKGKYKPTACFGLMRC